MEILVCSPDRSEEIRRARLSLKLGWVGFGVVKLTRDQAVLLPRKEKA